MQIFLIFSNRKLNLVRGGKVMKSASLIKALLVVALLFAPPQPLSAGDVIQPSEWNNLVQAARKEGRVIVYGNIGPGIRDAVTLAFKEKFAIGVEWVLGRPAEVIAKLKAERAAGLKITDIGFFGGTSFINDIKPMGINLPLDPLLVLPEVRDPKNWRGGKLPYFDKERMAFCVLSLATSYYQRNINLVSEKEISSTMDLLNPKWRGKIVMGDPSIAGGANSWLTWMLEGILGKEKGIQFMKKLVNQNPMITRDERQLTEWVSRGKYEIGIGSSVSVPAKFIQMGAPIAFIDTKEPRSLSSGFGIVEAFKDAPHPNAAKLLLNWTLSREGSTIFSRAAEYPSTRADVPPGEILPILVPRPDDVDPYIQYENYESVKGEMRKVAAGIFVDLAK
jgi:iron(III) transport system substrate-binding protein